MNTVNEFDIIIIGGGIVGSAAACELAKQFERVAIVDNTLHSPWRAESPFSLRVSALNLASSKFLDELGVWQQVQTMRSFPYTAMVVWEQSGDARIEFNANDTAHTHLGTIVENQVLLTALNKQLSRQRSITRYDGCCLENVTAVGESSMLVELDNGERISAQLVIGADGQRSKVRECMSIETSHNAYHQAGLVCNVQTELPHENTAWQCFTQDGPLALLPLQKNLCSVVWSVPQSRSEQLLKLADSHFNIEISSAFEHALGKVKVISERKSFVLQGAHSDRYIGHRVVLMGDAAHVVHPLAGLGLNLGLEDVRCLCELLVSTDRALGSDRVLRKYERERKSENLIMQRALEAIDSLFRSEQPAVRTIRSLGVNFTNKVLPLKLLFMQRAMGVPV